MLRAQQFGIVVADDHLLILDRIAKLMRLEAEFQNIASCRDSDAAPQAIRRHAPDNTLIDYVMPELDEVYILSTVRSERIRHPNCIA